MTIQKVKLVNDIDSSNTIMKENFLSPLFFGFSSTETKYSSAPFKSLLILVTSPLLIAFQVYKSIPKYFPLLTSTLDILTGLPFNFIFILI